MDGQTALPHGFYSADPQERVEALRHTSVGARNAVLAGVHWPMYSPGALNAWVVFLGGSPGASPGEAWHYDPLPSVGGPHPGVAQYDDTRGYWNGIRLFARAILRDLAPADAYAATMVRNLDPRQSANGPRGPHMVDAAYEARDVLDRVIRPTLIVALGGVREYSDSAFAQWPEIIETRSGVLRTARRADPRPWVSMLGAWSDGGRFLYVSPSGVHPSLHHVSVADSVRFLGQQADAIRGSGPGV